MARVSPTSRSRKRKPKRQGAAADDGPEAFFRELIRSYRPLLAVDDQVEVAAHTSAMLGSLWYTLHADPDIEDSAVADGDLVVRALISFAAGQRGGEALALLRAVEEIGDTAGVREAAAEAAAAVAGRGVAEPSWRGRLTDVRVERCWCLDSTFGDEASLLCVFACAGRRYGIMAMIDYSAVAPEVDDLFVVDTPDEVLDRLRGDVADNEDVLRLREIPPATARGLLEEGIAGNDGLTGVPPDETFAQFRAWVLAWCRTMPEPEAREPVDERRRAEIVSEFLSSAPARELPDDPGVARLVRSIVDFGCDEDRGQPLRVSPDKLAVLAEELVFDDDDLAIAVLAAWARWAGERNELPAELVDELVEYVDAAGWLDEDLDDALDLILDGLSDVADEEERAEAAARRMFAMPFSSAVIGDEDYPFLDPNDPDERHLLVVGSHPEYHEVLDDPAAEDVEIDGVNPHLHLALEEIVINQLWDDNPPEAWQAAKRLADQAVDRHEILTRIAGALAPTIRQALAGQEPDLAEYVRALDALGR